MTKNGKKEYETFASQKLFIYFAPRVIIALCSKLKKYENAISFDNKKVMLSDVFLASQTDL